MDMTVTEYRCENCGGVLDVTPETIVAICKYCGHANWFIEDKERILIVPSLTRDEIESSFRIRLSEDFDLKRIKNKIKIVDVSGIYIPFYFVTVKTEAHYSGVKHERVREGSGKHARWRVVKKRVSGKLSSVYKVPVMGRRSAEDFSIKELTDYYKYDNPQAIDLEEVKNWKELKLSLLKAEISASEAVTIAKDTAVDELRAKAELKVDELDRFICKANVLERSPLTLLPYWYIIYSYGNAQYRAAYAGWNKHLLAAQEPIMRYHRALYFLGALAGCVISAAGLSLGLNVFESPYLSLFTIVVGSGISYYFGTRLVSDVRVER